MKLSNLVIEPKHRSQWSAIDLGFLLARENYGKLLLAWLMPSLPLFVLLLLILPQDYLFWAIVIVWWLKPFWDRLPLMAAGKLLFSETVTFSDLKKSLASVLTPSFLPWLSYRRFSPERSYILPVLILEKLTGQAFSKRVANLHYGIGSGPSWLTVICVHFEMILVVGFYGFLWLLIPNEVEMDYWQMMDQQEAYAVYINAVATYVGMALIAPFYVCAGFMLYINQRIYLEGWDIELRFRAMADKIKREKAALFNASKLKVLLFCSFIALQGLATDHAFAKAEATQAGSENTVTIETREQAKTLIEQIKAGEDFSSTKTVTAFRLVNAKDDADDQDDSENSWWIEFIQWLFDGAANSEGKVHDTASLIAKVVEVMLWALALILIGWLLNLSVKWFKQLPPSSRVSLATRNAPEVMFGLDLTEQLSSKMVVSKAQHYLAENNYRQAVATVYAALLQRLIKDYHFQLKEGFTEQECAKLVLGSTAQSHEPLKPFVSFITKHWLQLAYAHQPVANKVCEKIITDWEVLFDGR